MRFPTPLVPARLIRRYKRFLADCELENGQEITAHCANPGSMMGLASPGTKVWLEPTDNPKRKLKFTWRLIEHHTGHFIGVDTSLPNKLMQSVLQNREVGPLAEYGSVRAEVPYGTNSRIDFLLSATNLPDAYVEVKSVTLSRKPGLAEFPDSVTARGSKHLSELINMVRAGNRAIMFFLIQRTDATAFRPAFDIDPTYATTLEKAERAGVQCMVYRAKISVDGIELGEVIPRV